jgi:hypothetical protein
MATSSGTTSTSTQSPMEHGQLPSPSSSVSSSASFLSSSSSSSSSVVYSSSMSGGNDSNTSMGIGDQPLGHWVQRGGVPLWEPLHSRVTSTGTSTVTTTSGSKSAVPTNVMTTSSSVGITSSVSSSSRTGTGSQESEMVNKSTNGLRVPPSSNTTDAKPRTMVCITS